jgi:hypothetical protein
VEEGVEVPEGRLDHRRGDFGEAHLETRRVCSMICGAGGSWPGRRPCGELDVVGTELDFASPIRGLRGERVALLFTRPASGFARSVRIRSVRSLFQALAFPKTGDSIFSIFVRSNLTKDKWLVQPIYQLRISSLLAFFRS